MVWISENPRQIHFSFTTGELKVLLFTDELVGTVRIPRRVSTWFVNHKYEHVTYDKRSRAWLVFPDGPGTSEFQYFLEQEVLSKALLLVDTSV